MSGAGIPAAAVRVAVRAFRAKVEWIDRNSRDDYGREDELGMHAALEAAAPHMLAEAWEAGRDAEFQRSVMNRRIEPNPYGPTP